MKGSEITTEEVADKIAELILSQTYISKDILAPKINAYLKAFVKIQSIPKLNIKDVRMSEILKRKKESALNGELATYYASELAKVVGMETIKQHNIKAQSIKDAYNGNPIELINKAV